MDTKKEGYKYKKGNLVYGSIYNSKEKAKEMLKNNYSFEKEWNVYVVEGILHDDDEFDLYD